MSYHNARAAVRLHIPVSATLTLLLCLVVARVDAATDTAPEWWSPLPAEILADLNLGESAVSLDDDDAFLTMLPEPWRVREGGVVVEGAFGAMGGDGLQSLLDESLDDALLVGDEPGGGRPKRSTQDRMLKATEHTLLCAGDVSWSNYVVTAEVMMGAPGPLRLSALNVETDDALTAGYQLAVRGGQDETSLQVRFAQSTGGEGDGPSESAWQRFLLRPDPRRLATVRYTFIETQMAQEDIEKKAEAFALAEGRPDQFWNTKWLRLRIEAGDKAVRMWLDGVLIAWIDRPPQVSGSMCLELNEGDRVRLLRVQRLPAGTPGFVPLDLKSRYNAAGIGDGSDLGTSFGITPSSLPGAEEYITVGGIPFLWSSREGLPDNVDISKVTVTGGPRYIHGNAFQGEYKHRVLLQVPSRQYGELAVIAATDTEGDRTGMVGLRMFMTSRAMWTESLAHVPAWNEAPGSLEAVALPIQLRGKAEESVQAGKLWLVRIPLDPGSFQSFIGLEGNDTLQVDLTGGGGRSGVRVFAATLLESPVQMKVLSGEIGHVFVEPQVPTFDFKLRNATAVPREGMLDVYVGDFYGETNRHEFAYSLAPGEMKTVSRPVPVKLRGHHDLDVRLLDADGKALVRRHTTFALLPPDTRLADKDSPWGMWTFNWGHYGAGPEASSQLMSKLGVRYSHHSDPQRKLYKNWYSFRGLEEEEECLELLKGQEDVDHWTVFAESSLGSGESTRHFGRFPTELLEKPAPLELNAAEKVKLRSYWDGAVRFSETVRKYYPEKKLVFGNGYPQFIISFLANGYPKKYLDGLALDFIGDNMNMFFYLGKVAEHYGYGDVPFFISEGFYLGSGRGLNPDRVSEIRQSDGYVRGFLRGLAMGMERYLGSSEPWDAGGDYYLSGYGPVGLCHRAPETNPKPGYPAYATMTLLLDQARFHSLVPTGSLNVYMLRFDGSAGPVYALWTVRGERTIRLAVGAGASPRLTDSQCNDSVLETRDGRTTFKITGSPIWLRNASVVDDVVLDEAAPDGAPAADARRVCSFSSADEWLLDTNPCEAMEEHGFTRPVAVGAFALGTAEGVDSTPVLSVTLQAQPELSDHRLRYAALRPRSPVAIPSGCESLGVWVYGNGAATVDVELRDTEGEVWHGIRGRRYGCGMRAREPFMFDGWRYMRFPLPPRSSDKKGNGKPDEPFELAGLVLQQYAKVLCVNQLMAPASATWRIGDIFCE